RAAVRGLQGGDRRAARTSQRQHQHADSLKRRPVIRKILVCFAFVIAVQAIAPAKASADCGAAGDVPCYVWDWCAYKTYGLVGDSYCWGGLVYATKYNGCDNDRLNNWGLVCVACGAAGQPTCDFGTTCDT